MMWRALFLAIGVSLAILGAESMVLEKVVMAASKPQAGDNRFFTAALPAAKGREIVPPEWAPWGLLSAGAVVILYSFTIPRRVGK